MTKIQPNAIILKDIVLRFETADDFAPAVSSAVFTPTSSAVNFTGMSPGAAWSDSSEPTWTLDLTFVQDWESAKSLSKYLYLKAGDKEVVTFQPKDGAALPAFTSEVVLQHGPIGGPGGQYPTATVRMGCTKPELDSDNAPATPEPAYPEA